MKHLKTRLACMLVLLPLLAPSAAAETEVVFERTWHIDGSRLDQDALVETGTFTVDKNYNAAALVIGCSHGASGVFVIARADAPTAWFMECVNAVVPTGETGVLRDANPHSAWGGGALSLRPGEYTWAFVGAGFGDVTVRILGAT